MSFLLRVLNLGVSAWEMISNQHFTEVALVCLSYLFLLLMILIPSVFLNRLLQLHTCSNFSVMEGQLAWALFYDLLFFYPLMHFRVVS